MKLHSGLPMRWMLRLPKHPNRNIEYFYCPIIMRSTNIIEVDSGFWLTVFNYFLHFRYKK